MHPDKSELAVRYGKQIMLAICLAIVSGIGQNLLAQRKMERLNRGVVAVRTSATNVFISWRLLGTEPSNLAFNIYRGAVKINSAPITGATNYTDGGAIATDVYKVVPVLNNIEQINYPTGTATVWAKQFMQIPLMIPPAGITPSGEAYTYNANDASVGDLDGDGEYEIILKWDPSNSKDNSQSGYTGNVYIDAYKLNGTRLWRIDLGRNIRAGAHYTQFLVYDFDSDGKAEMACKTADGTTDATGVIIGNPSADYRNTAGYVLSGPEFLTVFNGMTGAAMATTNYLPARGTVSSWGDNYGNRVDRFIACVSYLDGIHPSIVMGRGYYTRLVRVAWDWRNGQFTHRWTFDSNTPGNSAYAGQGNHQLITGDVDGDGKDEMCNGASSIKSDGTGHYANGLGHGDAIHMSDMDPDRPGQEVWQCHEEPAAYGIYGLEFRDAKTGQPLWGVPGNNSDVGRGIAADVDPRHKGYECWGSVGGLYNCKGVQIGTARPSVNHLVWWDGDLSRELLDGTKLEKWNYNTNSLDRLLTLYLPANGNSESNNGTKANPAVTADLFGDWREEIVQRSYDNLFLNIFTTINPTSTRLYTLMHDPQYRLAVAWQNTAYNQPPHPSFYLGDQMEAPPVPNIAMVDFAALPLKILSFTAKQKGSVALIDWSVTNEVNNDYFAVEKSVDGLSFNSIGKVNTHGNSASVNAYSFTDIKPLAGLNYYRLKQVDNDGRFAYSEIKTVRFNNGRQLQVYPNPVGSFIKITLATGNSYLKMKLTGIDGRIIQQISGSISNINAMVNHLLPLLKPGYYNLQVEDKDQVFNARFTRL